MTDPDVNLFQDLSAFSGDAFDVRDWINATFRAKEAHKQPKEVGNSKPHKKQS